jgi:hypothetical protein
MCLHFGFVIFWQKNFGAKAAHKMLVKLTPELHSKGGLLSLAPNITLMAVTSAAE